MYNFVTKFMVIGINKISILVNFVNNFSLSWNVVVWQFQFLDRKLFTVESTSIFHWWPSISACMNFATAVSVQVNMNHFTIPVIKFCMLLIPYLFYYKFQSSYLFIDWFWFVTDVVQHRQFTLKISIFLTLLMKILHENTVNPKGYHLNCLKLSWKFSCKKWLLVF
jgi:hypothetical protein